MMFTVNDLPEGTTGVRLTADKAIAGDFELVEEDGYLVAKAGTTGTKSVTVNFSAAETSSTMSFYFPVPVGEYTIEIAYLKGEQSTTILKSNKTIPVARKQLRNMSAVELKIKAGDNYYATLAAALNAKETEIELAPGEYTLTNITTETLKITGPSTKSGAAASAEAVKIKFPLDAEGKAVRIKAGNANLTFENVTIIVPVNQNYVGFESKEITFNDCIIENQYCCYSSVKTLFNNCSFRQTDLNWYNVWTYNTDVDFYNCKFNNCGRSALVFAESHQAEIVRTVNFNKCDFHTDSYVSGKAAIEIDSSLRPYNVIITNCTSDGFDFGSTSGDTLYNLKKGTIGVNCNINVDGFDVIAKGLTYNPATKVYSISKPEGLVYANDNLFAQSGMTYTLTDNIDMSGIEWATKIVGAGSNDQVSLTFDGNGKTISNWSTTSEALLVGKSNNNNITIKNLNLYNCTVNSSTNNAALLVGQSELHTNSKITIEKVNVNESSISSGKYAGALIGWVAGSDQGRVVITDCSVKNTTLTGNGSTAAFIGHDNAGATTIENAVVTGCTIKGETLDKSGIVVGTVQRETSMSVSNVSGNTVFDVANSEAVYGRIVGGCLFMDGAATVNGQYIPTAINAGVSTINLTEGNYTFPNAITSTKNTTGKLTFIGSGENTVISGSANASGLHVKMQSLKWNDSASKYPRTAFTHANSVVFEDCYIEGEYYAQSSAPHTFTRCTIDPKTSYLYTYCADCTFNNCTFNSSEGKALQVYGEASSGESTVTINNCKFIAAKQAVSGAMTNVTAIDINSDKGHKFNVIVSGYEEEGFPTAEFSNSSLWNIKDGADNVKVTVNGADVYVGTNMQ